jgi:hypothetical protein
MTEETSIPPAVFVVLGRERAKRIQSMFNSKEMQVISFESTERLPTVIRGAIVDMPDQKIVGGFKVSKLEAWLDEFISSRLAPDAEIVVLGTGAPQ